MSGPKTSGQLAWIWCFTAFVLAERTYDLFIRQQHPILDSIIIVMWLASAILLTRTYRRQQAIRDRVRAQQANTARPAPVSSWEIR